MAARTRAVEDASTKASVLFAGRRSTLKGGLRRIGWDSARYFELDGICFIVEGFKLGKNINSAESHKRVTRRTLHTPASFGQSLYDFAVVVTP